MHGKNICIPYLIKDTRSYQTLTNLILERRVKIIITIVEFKNMGLIFFFFFKLLSKGNAIGPDNIQIEVWKNHFNSKQKFLMSVARITLIPTYKYGRDIQFCGALTA
jgi:hypothetical protein